MANPEVTALKQRIAKYHQQHPEFAQPNYTHIRRKKHFPQKRLPPGQRCAYCGKLLSKHTVTLDHVIPLSRGGSDDPDNLVWCCLKCNHEKGSKLLSEWRSEDQCTSIRFGQE